MATELGFKPFTKDSFFGDPNAQYVLMKSLDYDLRFGKASPSFFIAHWLVGGTRVEEPWVYVSWEPTLSPRGVFVRGASGEISVCEAGTKISIGAFEPDKLASAMSQLRPGYTFLGFEVLPHSFADAAIRWSLRRRAGLPVDIVWST